jgi:leucyl aminopeptidase (aminopeptidase T)
MRRALVCIALSLLAHPAAADDPPDLARLAHRIVVDVARIKPGELVLVSGPDRFTELLEELAVAVHQAGGAPLVVHGSERLTRRYFAAVPASHDAAAFAFDEKLADVIDAEIRIMAGGSLIVGEGPGGTSFIPEERLRAMWKASAKAEKQRTQRRVRLVFLYGGFYPTPRLAELFHLPVAQLEQLFLRGLDVDYAQLHARALAVAQRLQHAKRVRLTHANGTDVSFRVDPASVVADDGALGDDKLVRNIRFTNLPAGRVDVRPLAGSVEGRIVIDRELIDDHELRGLVLTFKKGALSSMTAQPGRGWDTLRASYTNAPAGKERLAALQLGVNDKLALPADTSAFPVTPSGVMAINLGNDEAFGGSNRVDWDANFGMVGCSLLVDGKLLVDRGKLLP